MSAPPIQSIQDLAWHIDGACAKLFDLFCERRCIVPLAFLMHNWPLVRDELSMVQRLIGTLGDLLINYHHALEYDEKKLIVGVLADVSDWTSGDKLH